MAEVVLPEDVFFVFLVADVLGFAFVCKVEAAGGEADIFGVADVVVFAVRPFKY